METTETTVTLGVNEYTLVAQPHVLILRKFPRVFAGLQDTDALDVDSASGVVDLLGDKVYDALAIFIPDLMPKHEFEGFATNEKLAAGEFDEAYAAKHAPTVPQILDAVDAALEVNGGKRLKNLLGNVLGPDLIRAVRATVVAQLRVQLSKMSPSSPSVSDGSETSTPSGTTPPTTRVEEF